jgi:hypothetical protein
MHEDSLHPRLCSGASARPLNFTVRRQKIDAIAWQRVGRFAPNLTTAQRGMEEHDWVSVGKYASYMSAQVVSGRLSNAGVQNRIWAPPRSVGENYVWVPPESADAAKRILAEPAVSEEELCALALKDPPPDDFEPSNTDRDVVEASNPIKNVSSPALLLAAVLVISAIAAFLFYVPGPTGYEVMRQRSPDGTADAVLLEIRNPPAGTHSYRVCLHRPNGIAVTASNCREVAYIGGVSSNGVSQPVRLVWTAPSQLEIHYTSATSIHIYKPVFVWGSTGLGAAASRYGISLPIFIRAVQTGDAAGQGSVSAH